MIEIILLLACCCFIFIVVLAGWFLNRGEEGDECEGKDENGTYEIDEDLKCVLESCDTGYYKSGKKCLVDQSGAACVPTGTPDPQGTYLTTKIGGCGLSSCETDFVVDGTTCARIPPSAPTGLYSTTDGIRQQANNPDGEHLFWYRHTNSPWAKHYKFSCKTPEGEESEKVGPYGPVTMGNYQGPLLRMGAAGTKPCGETNKMRIYRNDTSDGIYEDLTDSMRNLAGDAAYGGVLPSFLDTHGIAAVRT